MEYYKLLQLEREPFSNTPDPNYFFQSRQHHVCLQKIELAIRLKRGLNVVIGDMGTGKTTLCRELIRRLSQQDDFETHLILDPAFSSPHELLTTIFAMLYGHPPQDQPSLLKLKESVKQRLFYKGVDEGCTVVLIIDEGQKITDDCVEILRELLNYETNEYKLLQIVIFAQQEFDAILQSHANFADRINLLHQLAPMDFKDTRRMIRHRIKLAGSGVKPLNMFTLPAQWAIYRSTRGYPRRIIHLCHQSILAMIIQNRSRAGWRLIRSCKKRMMPAHRPRQRRASIFGLPAVVTMAAILVLAAPFYLFHIRNTRESQLIFKVPVSDTSRTAVKRIDAAPASPPSLSAPAGGDTEPVSTSIAQGFSDEAVAAEAPMPQNADEHPMAPAEMQTALVAKANTDQHDGQSTITPKAESTRQPPSQLGRLTVKPGDTISAMVIRVYGHYRNDYVQAILAANPHIQDPNNIRLDEVITLPTLDFGMKPTSVDCHWIALDQRPDLAGALKRSAELSRQLQMPTRVMALWSPDKDLRFELLLKGYFADSQSALDEKALLPDEFSQTARVFDHWDADTRLYSDPYAGGVRKSQPE